MTTAEFIKMHISHPMLGFIAGIILVSWVLIIIAVVNIRKSDDAEDL